jgi:hypothetical protein
MYSGASRRFSVCMTVASRSSRIEQQTQPLAGLITSFWTPTTSSTSMLIAPKSLTQDGHAQAVIAVQDAVEQGRLSRAEKPGQDGDRDDLGAAKIDVVPASAKFRVVARHCHDIRPRSATGTRKRHFDTAILRAALCRVVRGDRVCVAEPLCRDEVGLDTLREQECHHIFGAFLREDLV